jgi:hypothetical protein
VPEIDPAPDGAAALLPRFARPALDAEVLALVGRIERVEFRPDQHVLVGAGGVGLPDHFPAALVERLERAAHAQFAAGIAHQHFARGDQRGHRHRLALGDVGHRRAPDLRPGIGVERDHLPIQRDHEQAPVVVAHPAADHVAAGDPLRFRIRLGVEAPFDRCTGLAQVQRIDNVGIRRFEVHRRAEHQRRGFVALPEAGIEGKRQLQLADVLRGDLGEVAEAAIGVIASGN